MITMICRRTNDIVLLKEQKMQYQKLTKDVNAYILKKVSDRQHAIDCYHEECACQQQYKQYMRNNGIIYYINSYY